MKRIVEIVFLFLVSTLFYCQNWTSLHKDMRRYQMQCRLFSKNKKWNRRYINLFKIALSNIDLLKLTNSQVGDTLYLNERVSVEGGMNVNFMNNKRDYIYSLSICGSKKQMTLELTKEKYETNKFNNLILEWDFTKMRKLSDRYPKVVFDDCENHFTRIVLLKNNHYEMQTFVNRGFEIDEN